MKDFVEYQEALELKQLGFDETCFAYFSESQQLHLCKFENMSDRGFVSAPMYAQAFRWFREKHGLCLVIKPIDDKKLELGYSLLKNGLIMNAHLTYEEAELACLRRLIEIVKQNDQIQNNN